MTTRIKTDDSNPSGPGIRADHVMPSNVSPLYFINTNIGVLSGRLLSLEGVIKIFIF